MSRYSYYQIEVRHDELHKYRYIRGTDRYVVEQKAAALRSQWDEEWDRRRQVLNRQEARAELWASIEDSKEKAVDATAHAQAKIVAVQTVLAHSLATDDRIDWEGLKNRSHFDKPQPRKPSAPLDIAAPNSTDPRYQPKHDFLCWFSSSRKARIDAHARARFDADLDRWTSDRAGEQDAYKKAIERYDISLTSWNAEKTEFAEAQALGHSEIDARKAAFKNGDEGAVLDGIDVALSRSVFPDFINVDYSIDYAAITKSLVIDFDLPNPDQTPTLKDVRYVQSRNEFTEKHVTDAEKTRLYDGLLFQICLRVIDEIFEADEYEHVERITFNGWVDYVDRSTGVDKRSCIMTVGVNRQDFVAVDLSRVDPKECFRALKGVSASKLIGLAPVAPLERQRTPDPRFIEGEDVASEIQDTTNLAAMDWKDFEHLVRQVFEAEFASSRGDVRVTQASRDGGVDAVIFDPDPIRGGKIVVQAKRYVNTVEVGAVRDLYGTVLNEGATKGILITTSQFGPDARKFAQDKPITLLDGGNLLHMLAGMGIKARINLQEAREFLKDQAPR
jgi:restriction system protein